MDYIILEDQIIILDKETGTYTTYTKSEQLINQLENGEDIVEEVSVIEKLADYGYPFGIDSNNNVHYMVNWGDDDVVITDDYYQLLCDYQDDLSKVDCFFDKLFLSDRSHVVTGLCSYVRKHGIELTDDGDMVMYKGVRDDYKDIYTGTVDNSPGSRVLWAGVLPVEDDRHIACARGYHCGTHRYATSYAGSSGKVVAVHVNPADVVSIPYDADEQKVRTNGYYVVCRISGS